MVITHRTKCHPEAKGNTPKSGDVEYKLKFPLDTGDLLIIEMGQLGWDIVGQFILDEAAERPSYSDGSEHPEDPSR